LVQREVTADIGIVVDDVQDAVIAMVWADVFHLVHPIFRATDGAFEAQDVLHKSPPVEPVIGDQGLVLQRKVAHIRFD